MSRPHSVAQESGCGDLNLDPWASSRNMKQPTEQHLLEWCIGAYHLAGNFWGRKLLWILSFCDYLWKFYKWNLASFGTSSEQSAKVFSTKILFSTNLQKFFPMKVSQYGICGLYESMSLSSRSVGSVTSLQGTRPCTIESREVENLEIHSPLRYWANNH